MRTTSEPGAILRLGEVSPEDEREASLPPEPGDDVYARATRPVGADVFARATLPNPAVREAHASVPDPADRHQRPTVPGGVQPVLRPTVPGGAAPMLRPTVPGVYPDAASEAALREAHPRRTAVEIRRPPSERPARPTEPIAGTFMPAAPLPFAPSPEPSRTSLSPVATSGSRPNWSATSGDALPAVSRRKPTVAVLAVGVAIAVGCVAALIGRAVHRPEASAAQPAPIVVVAPPPAEPAAAPEPTEAPRAEATPPATASPIAPRAKPKQASPIAPKPAATASAPRAPHRPFDVDGN
jgi:hypothetical protein